MDYIKRYFRNKKIKYVRVEVEEKDAGKFYNNTTIFYSKHAPEDGQLIAELNDVSAYQLSDGLMIVLKSYSLKNYIKQLQKRKLSPIAIYE